MPTLSFIKFDFRCFDYLRQRERTGSNVVGVRRISLVLRVLNNGLFEDASVILDICQNLSLP